MRPRAPFLGSVLVLVALTAAHVAAADDAAVRDTTWRLVPRDTLVSSRLAEPSGLAIDAFGRLWVSDAALHRVVRFSDDGTALDETGALGSEPGQFRRPCALAVTGALGVAVLDLENRRVSLYDHHLRLLGAACDLAAPALEDRIGRVTPVALAADRGGAIHVADGDRDRILLFDFAGTFLREWGGFGGRAGGFSGLMGLAANGRGTLITIERPRSRSRRADADSLVGRARVQWLDAGGRVVRSVWTPTWAAGAAEQAFAVAVDATGRVAIVGERSGQVCVLAPDGGALVMQAGLRSPRGVVFGADGALLVAEAGAARIVRFALRSPGGE
jgi:hypothetical protein